MEATEDPVSNYAETEVVGKFYFHCIGCKQKLSCPKNTLIVECPICNEIIMPYTEYIVICLECNHKLHYPPSAQVIRCSNKLCQCLMDVSVNPIQKCKLTANGKIKRQMSHNNNNHNINNNNNNNYNITNPYKSAFEFFCDSHENNPEYVCMSNKFKQQQLNMKWDNLNVTQRDKYVQMSINNRKEYFQQLQKSTLNDNNDYNEYQQDEQVTDNQDNYDKQVNITHSENDDDDDDIEPYKDPFEDANIFDYDSILSPPKKKRKYRKRKPRKKQEAYIYDEEREMNKEWKPPETENKIDINYDGDDDDGYDGMYINNDNDDRGFDSTFNYKAAKNVDKWGLNDIWKWLSGIGMNKYINELKSQFDDDGIVGSDLKDITNLDWQDYGVRDEDDRKWILQNIEILSKQ